MRLARVAFLLTVLIGTWAASACAAAPESRQARLLLRILAYDQRLAARAKDVITVAVLYRPGRPESEAGAGAMFASLDSLRRKVSVAGLPVRVVMLSATDAVIAEAGLRRENVAAVYIGSGWSDLAPALAAATRRLGALSFTGSEPKGRDGFSIGLVQREDRMAIIVNLPAVIAEGARLDAGLLQVAEVRR
jgi:hypothetical protein